MLNAATTTDPVDHENANRHWLNVAGWWEPSGLDEHWPLSTDEAASMLSSAGQYDIDAAGLLDMIERNLLPRPAVEGDDLEWNATDVCTAGHILESREQWKATPCGHDRKKHCFQIALENARQRDIVGSLVESGGPRYDLKGLLPAIVKEETLEGRRQIVALLKAVLQTEHEIVI